MTQEHKEWLKEYYSQLLGFKVIGSYIEEGDTHGAYNNEFPVLVMTNGKGSTFKVTVSMDEEGNGSGFLFLDKYNNMSFREIVGK